MAMLLHIKTYVANAHGSHNYATAFINPVIKSDRHIHGGKYKPRYTYAKPPLQWANGRMQCHNLPQAFPSLRQVRADAFEGHLHNNQAYSIYKMISVNDMYR